MVILSPYSVRTVTRRVLGPSVLTFAITVLVVILTRTPGWFSVGGAIISAIGTRHWARRLFRLTPAGADEPLPPSTFAVPGSRLVALNSAHFAEGQQRALDNLYAYIGVWLSITGGIIASVAPFLLDRFWLTEP